MKSAIWILLGLAVSPVLAENASAPAKPVRAAVTPAALIKSAQDNIAARDNEDAGMLAPPPATDASREPSANRRGPQDNALIPPPPGAEVASAPNAPAPPPANSLLPPLNNSAPAAPAKAAPVTSRAANSAVLAPPTVEIRGANATSPAPNTASTASSAAPPAPLPKKALVGDFAGPDVAVILARNQFFPSTIRLHSGNPTRLLFTTVNRKPGALILERLQVQRWIPGEPAPAPLTESERAKQEVDRELNSLKITEIVIDPKPGEYTFYDALSGAAGEIVVE